MADGTTSKVEAERAAYLRDAEDKAVKLFDEIERDLIRAGVGEKKLSDEIHELATKRYGVRTHWHKRVIRSGPNTLLPFEENPPDRVIQPDDILYVDLGPVFEEWEADFGRTYVLGDDEKKKKLRDALVPVWDAVKVRFDADPDITGGQLYDIACEEAAKLGFSWGAYLAGHTIGSFPHERIPKDKVSLYIVKENDQKMRRLDKKGNLHHWILEVHLRDKDGEFGGFFEKLLTV